MSDLVFLNGEYLKKHDAKVSILDRGFLFGDGVYEVIPVYQQRPFRLQEHLNRLNHSAQLININSPFTDSQWLVHINTIILKYHQANLSIYIQITRGVQRPMYYHLLKRCFWKIFAGNTVILNQFLY